MLEGLGNQVDIFVCCCFLLNGYEYQFLICTCMLMDGDPAVTPTAGQIMLCGSGNLKQFVSNTGGLHAI